MDTRLKEKVVLITGAAGGIGSELVKSFAHEGATVVAHYHRAPLEAATTAALAIKADLTREDEVRCLFAEAERRFKRVDVLVANAGIWPARETPIYEMSLEQWNNTLATNLTSIFLCFREFLRGIRNSGVQDPAGIIIGSTAGIYGEAGHCDYAASKAGAMQGLLLSLKNEIARIAPHGRINAVCPGWVLTPMAGDFKSKPEAVMKVLQTVALRKVGRVEDIASAVVFLASSKLAGHMSGQSVVVSGGMEGRVLYQPNEIDVSKA